MVSSTESCTSEAKGSLADSCVTTGIGSRFGRTGNVRMFNVNALRHSLYSEDAGESVENGAVDIDISEGIDGVALASTGCECVLLKPPTPKTGSSQSF